MGIPGSSQSALGSVAGGVTGKRVLLAEPRGYCAGVDRAIQIVVLALKAYGAPVYVRHEIVHNRYVVEDLRQRGAVFVEELHEVPDDAIVIFSAHGVSKAVQDEAERRQLQVFDATCPLVTKVHMEVIRYAREGRESILIGHAGHPEVEGTMGQYDKSYGGDIYLVEDEADVARLEVTDPDNLAFVTQTTLSVDDTARIIDALRSRTQMIRIPSTSRATMLDRMRAVAETEGVGAADGVLEDIAYISEGNLRKALFTLEMLHIRGLARDRSAVHRLVQATTLQSGRHLLELALRGRVVEWRWESRGGRKKRILAGALAEVDRLMNDHGLDSDDVVSQLHDVLVGRRLSLPDALREEVLSALADCDAQLTRSMHARIPFENFLHKVARAGHTHGLAFG